MFISTLDMFKVGVGPSSSHTMGPMTAAARFLDLLRARPFTPAGLRASLHGSLAFTGIGHATDRAVILGLAGFTPAAYEAEAAEAALAAIRETRRVAPDGLPTLAFDPSRDLAFDYGPPLPGHANGLRLTALDAQGDAIAQETYYSVGGGFVLTEAELSAGRDADPGAPRPPSLPHRRRDAGHVRQRGPLDRRAQARQRAHAPERAGPRRRPRPASGRSCPPASTGASPPPEPCRGA